MPKVDRCHMCGRRIKYDKDGIRIWCHVCIARHKINEPCPRCNGETHWIGPMVSVHGMTARLEDE